MRPALPALIISIVAIAACGPVTLRPHTAPEPGTVGIPGPDEDAVARIPGQPDPGLMPRTACRTGVERGWVAVQYLQLGKGCPRTEDDNGYDGALLQRYSDRAPGTVLVICADQPIPTGWVPTESDADATCEGARVEADEPTTQAILKVR